MPYGTVQSVKSNIAKSIPNKTNATLLGRFLDFLKGIPTSEATQIKNLKGMIHFCNTTLDQNRTFYDVDRATVLQFLNSKIKSIEADPEQKWIRTWNDYLSILKYFYRWLYNIEKPGKQADEVPAYDWETPEFVNLRQKKTKRVSPYSVNEIWDSPEDLKLIIKYEPEARKKAAIMLLWDANGRNHEIVKLKLKHIKFKDRYAEGEIPHNTKTGGGGILLMHSLPYVRDWYNQHPFSNPEAYLICSLTGRPIKADELRRWMLQLKNRIQTALAKGLVMDEAEAEKLRSFLATKKWNPYCLRHSSISYDSDYLPEFALRKKVRWSMNSRQPGRYVKARVSEDLKKVMLQHEGIDDQPQKPRKPANIKCARCGQINAVENKVCTICNALLNQQALDELKASEEAKFKALQDQILEVKTKLFDELESKLNKDGSIKTEAGLASDFVKYTRRDLTAKQITDADARDEQAIDAEIEAEMKRIRELLKAKKQAAGGRKK